MHLIKESKLLPISHEMLPQKRPPKMFYVNVGYVSNLQRNVEKYLPCLIDAAIRKNKDDKNL